MDVGIRDLKAKLSEYLDRAARGERIRVTDRGRPKALLGPLLDAGAIARGVDEGWLTPGEAAEPAPVRRVRSRRSVAELMREDRDEAR